MTLSQTLLQLKETSTQRCRVLAEQHAEVGVGRRRLRDGVNETGTRYVSGATGT